MTQRKRKKLATKAEKHASDRLGGRFTYNSGAGDEKGDSRVRLKYTFAADGSVETVIPGYRIESKDTAKDSYRLHVKDWEIVRRNALSARESPIFHIRLRHPTTRDFAVVENVFYLACVGPAGPEPVAEGDPPLTHNVTYTALLEAPLCRFTLRGAKRHHRLVLLDFEELAQRIETLNQ